MYGAICVSYNFYIMGQFSRLTISVPQVNQVFQTNSKPTTKAANIALLREINRKYGAMAEKWGDVFEIEKGILIAFIATESGGKADITSFVGCCFGLMQVSPEAVWECANKFKSITGIELPSTVRAELSKIPNIFSRSLTSSTKSAIRNKLFDPNFNIMSGTMILRWLLERFSTLLTGAQLNKAIIGYNAGAYTKSINTQGKPNKVPIDTTTLVKMPTVPKETKGYLVKMLGVDGFVSLIYKDNAI
jgi:soluble lytic murein transglycosylase-like protein